MIPLVPPPQPRFDPDPTESHVINAFKSVFSHFGSRLASFGAVIYTAFFLPPFAGAISTFINQRMRPLANIDNPDAPMTWIRLAALIFCGLGVEMVYVAEYFAVQQIDYLVNGDPDAEVFAYTEPPPPVAPDPTMAADGLPIERPHEEPIPVAGDCHTGICDQCKENFEYWLDDCRRTNSAYAYCEACGSTAILSFNDPRMPKLSGCQAREKMCAALEPYLLRCDCGGQFKRDSSPRCPRCDVRLSAQWAGGYIQEEAFGTRSGWVWQGNWTGPYALVIESKLVNNNFRDVTGGVS